MRNTFAQKCPTNIAGLDDAEARTIHRRALDFHVEIVERMQGNRNNRI